MLLWQIVPGDGVSGVAEEPVLIYGGLFHWLCTGLYLSLDGLGFQDHDNKGHSEEGQGPSTLAKTAAGICSCWLTGSCQSLS